MVIILLISVRVYLTTDWQNILYFFFQRLQDCRIEQRLEHKLGKLHRLSSKGMDRHTKSRDSSPAALESLTNSMYFCLRPFASCSKFITIRSDCVIVPENFSVGQILEYSSVKHNLTGIFILSGSLLCK